jgi:hypothetical protein
LGGEQRSGFNADALVGEAFFAVAQRLQRCAALVGGSL